MIRGDYTTSPHRARLIWVEWAVNKYERTWRFMAIDFTEKKDKLEKYDARRFRDITLPAGMKNWYIPDFDDSQWTEGKGPIGKGVWKHSGITLDKFPSKWGDGEFLLMRTTFEVEDLNCDSYRIAILARQGFHVYLNGQKIHTYIWWMDNPYYRSIVLGKEEIKYLALHRLSWLSFWVDSGNRSSLPQKNRMRVR